MLDSVEGEHPTGDGPGVEARRQRYAFMAREKPRSPLLPSPHAGGSAFEEMRAVSDSAAGTKGGGDVDRFG